MIGNFVMKELNVIIKFKPSTARKVSKYGLFSGSYFPVFGLNMEIYSVNLRIQSKYGKIRSRKNSAFRLFSRSIEEVLSLKTGLISNRIEQCSNEKAL